MKRTAIVTISLLTLAACSSSSGATNTPVSSESGDQSTSAEEQTSAPELERHRAIGFGWEDTAFHSERDWPAIGADMADAGYDTADLAIGRPEWTLHEWDGHEDWVAPQAGGMNDIVAGLSTAGVDRYLLTVDTLLPETLAAAPEWMAISQDGSTGLDDVPSLAAWVEGPPGDMLEDYVRELADAYPDAEAIVLTEFFFNNGTFSENDLHMWERDTGNEDWPRDDDGNIEMTDEYLDWLTTRTAEFLGRIDKAAGDMPLVVDVRIDVADPQAGDPASGHDIDKILEYVDMVQPWVYYETGDEDAAAESVAVLNETWPGRVRPALGLWEADVASVSQVVETASDSPLLQVTPYSLTDGVLPDATE